MSVQQSLAEALNLYQSGQLDAANNVCQQLLTDTSEHVDAMRLIILIESQQSNHEAVIKWSEKLLKNNSTSVDTLCTYGLSLQILQQHEKAINVYDAIISMDRTQSPIWFNRGNALYALGYLDDALDSFNQALQINPQYVKALSNRAKVLQDQEQYQDALLSYDMALAIDAHNLMIIFNRGVVLQELNRLEEALASYDKVLSIDSNNVAAYCNKGVTLEALDRAQEAMENYRHALAIDANNKGALFNLALLLQQDKKYQQALDCYEKIIQISHHDNLVENVINVFLNTGICLQKLRQHELAIKYYDDVILRDPDHVTAHYNISFSLFLIGQVDRAWREYEWRVRVPEIAANMLTFDLPKWLGATSLEGKTILLYTEQGLGDAIQFCRYVSDVVALGAKVLLGAPSSLERLFSQIKGVYQIVTPGQVSALPIDYHCPLMSLPFALQTQKKLTLHRTPYLWSDSAQLTFWKNRLGKKVRPRVGLVWNGGKLADHEPYRSAGLQAFIDLFSVKVDFFCLQQELREEEDVLLAQHPKIKFFGSELKDFTDTAALIDLMDLVISVDTSVAHLAGAMGKRVWILLPWAPDWRWKLLDEKTSWYPTAHLFRQTVAGDWPSVITRVKNKLINALGFL